MSCNPYNLKDFNELTTPLNDIDLLSPFRATWGTVTADLMQQAISSVMGSIKWNKPKCWIPFNCLWNRPEIESIVVAYYNMAKKKQIPEYRYKSDLAKEVINEVAKVSLRNKEQVEEVLNYLYWGSIDKTGYISQKISLPVTSDYKKEEREMPEDYKKGTLESLFANITDTLGGVVDVTKWALIIGAVGVGAYALTQVNTTAKMLGKNDK